MSTEQDEKYFESIILRFAIFQNPADLSGKGCMIEFQKRSEKDDLGLACKLSTYSQHDGRQQ
jgi:hypothetical protein